MAVYIVYFSLGALFSYWMLLRRIEHTKKLHQDQMETAEKEFHLRLENSHMAAEVECQKKLLAVEKKCHELSLTIQIKDAENEREHQSILQERRLLESESRCLREDKEHIQHQLTSLTSLKKDYSDKLKNIARCSDKEIHEELKKELREQCAQELQELRKELLDQPEANLKTEAQRVLVDSIQRLVTPCINDMSATIVPIPSEDIKGRIIGREGRNIKCFESKTGTTLMIDESPGSVLISSFDPIRRGIAKIALENLIKDGRIHPASIEENVQRAEEEMNKTIYKKGESALMKMGIIVPSTEVTTLIGKLNYRYSYNQNTLDHSMEVARCCSLLASELGLNPEIAKRCGFFHDIGKAMDDSYEGSHAIVGSHLLSKIGEDPIVINAVGSHHHEIDPNSLYAPLVSIADAISASRPGARMDSLESYLRRIRQLEDVAKTFPGIFDVYALQAGREIRVVVSPDKYTDIDARELSHKLRLKIEEELNYPATIKIVVIREQRFVELAK